MKITAFLAALAATAACTPTQKLSARQASTGNLPVVSTSGNAFYANGERFYIRGVAYQPGGAADAADPLADLPSLRRDIQNFKKLGINTIRIYTVDNSVSHAPAMKMLDDAGMYLALDVNTPDFSLNRADIHLSYNDRYLQSVFATIDNFASYNNLLLFFSGNEVINAKNNTNTAPYIKAVTRDMKTYIANRGYRDIPVAYAAADVSENIEQQVEYFNCGADISRTDAFAINDYSWCDPSSFEDSGWSAKVDLYSGYGAPLFLAEFGCITNTRKWGEIASLYNANEMAPVFSGGLAYEYTVEENGYGLVDLKNGGFVPNADFHRLQRAFASTSNPTGNGGASRSSKASQCPARSKQWEVKDLTIPAPPSGIAKYMSNGAGKGPGIGKKVTPSHYGGNSYSESWVGMGGSQPSQSPSSGGGSSSGSGAPNAASSLVVTGGLGAVVTLVGAAVGTMLL